MLFSRFNRGFDHVHLMPRMRAKVRNAVRGKLNKATGVYTPATSHPRDAAQVAAERDPQIVNARVRVFV